MSVDILGSGKSDQDTPRAMSVVSHEAVPEDDQVVAGAGAHGHLLHLPRSSLLHSVDTGPGQQTRDHQVVCGQ